MSSSCTLDQDELNSRIRKLRERHEATKLELQRIGELCEAERNMKQRCLHREVEDEARITLNRVCTTSSTSAISNTSALHKLPRGKNKSFTAFEVREIERNNSILLDKITSHNRKPSQYRMDPGYFTKVSNSQVNRRKMQQQIERENMVLLKKIQAVKPFGMSQRK